MPSGQAQHFREAIAELSAAERSRLDLKKSVWSSTGFVGVTKVKGKFQARVQVPGDGRGGSKQRRQHSLPGLFYTAEDAAVSLAIFNQKLARDDDGRVLSPPKQNKQHKLRSKKPVAAVEPQRTPLMPPQMPQMPQMSMATAVAMPIAFPAPHAPFAVATPLPMAPIGLL